MNTNIEGVDGDSCWYEVNDIYYSDHDATYIEIAPHMVPGLATPQMDIWLGLDCWVEMNQTCC